MAKDLYLYDVYDTEDEAYVLLRVPLNEVISHLNISKTRIINAVLYGQRLRKRYVISRTYLDGSRNPIDAEPKIMFPEDLKKRWDQARLAAKRALRDPKAIERYRRNKGIKVREDAS